MSRSTDITNLYQWTGGNPSQYQEVGHAEQAQASGERWPMLSAVRPNRAAVVPVMGGPVVASDAPASMPVETVAQVAQAAQPIAPQAASPWGEPVVVPPLAAQPQAVQPMALQDVPRRVEPGLVVHEFERALNEMPTAAPVVPAAPVSQPVSPTVFAPPPASAMPFAPPMSPVEMSAPPMTQAVPEPLAVPAAPFEPPVAPVAVSPAVMPSVLEPAIVPVMPEIAQAVQAVPEPAAAPSMPEPVVPAPAAVPAQPSSLSGVFARLARAAPVADAAQGKGSSW